MAITKVTRQLLSTGINDNSNATAITIDSSERIGILQSSPTSNIHIGASGNDAKRELRIDGTNGSGQTFGFITEADGENGRVSFKVGQGNATPTQKLMIHPDGGICFNTDTAAVNALDDYEEGTWTPAFEGTSTSVTVHSAKYTRIGRIVHVTCYFSGMTASNNGSMQKVTGLPFDHTASTYAALSLGYCGTVNLNDALPIITSNYIYFHQNDGNSAVLTRADFYSRAGGVFPLLMSGVYMTSE